MFPKRIVRARLFDVVPWRYQRTQHPGQNMRIRFDNRCFSDADVPRYSRWDFSSHSERQPPSSIDPTEFREEVRNPIRSDPKIIENRLEAKRCH